MVTLLILLGVHKDDLTGANTESGEEDEQRPEGNQCKSVTKEEMNLLKKIGFKKVIELFGTRKLICQLTKNEEDICLLPQTTRQESTEEALFSSLSGPAISTQDQEPENVVCSPSVPTKAAFQVKPVKVLMCIKHVNIPFYIKLQIC